MSRPDALARAGARALLCVAALGTGAGARAIEMIAGDGPVSIPVTSLQGARFQRTLHQRYDFSCGSAALASLLTYQYDVPTTEETAFQAMFAQGDQDKIRHEGFSMLDMKRDLAALGFEADGYDVPLEQLERVGVPAIALIVDGGYHHFVVVKGLRQGRVLLGDPSRGTRLMTRTDFDGAWSDRILFVIHAQQRPDRRRAAFNAAADWARAPLAPLGDGVTRSGLDGATLMLIRPGAF